MAYIEVRKTVLTEEKKKEYQNACPFAAIKMDEQGALYIDDNCRLCKLCLKFGPETFFLVEQGAELGASLDIKDLKTEKGDGILVFIELEDKKIHPVGLQLLSKAQELIEVRKQEVQAIILGSELEDYLAQINSYPAEKIVYYSHPDLKVFNLEAYTEIICSYVNEFRPAVLLFGATPLGRHLAPAVATRLKTGLTADCTALDLNPENELIQTRPAFGGNIMAEIKTPVARPQIATVRPNIFKAQNIETSQSEQENSNKPSGLEAKKLNLADFVKIDFEVYRKNKHILIEKGKSDQLDLTQADKIVAVGRGIKKQEDLKIAEKLAQLLGAQLAFSRPLVETGWGSSIRQVGLSGRSVAPKLLITLGVSGSVQFLAGIKNAKFVISVNLDEKADIMKRADLALVGDLYEVLPELIEQLVQKKSEVGNDA